MNKELIVKTTMSGMGGGNTVDKYIYNENNKIVRAIYNDLRMKIIDISIDYDKDNRMTKIENKDNTLHAFSYNEQGDLVEYDLNLYGSTYNHIITREYDEQGRLIKSVDSRGDVIKNSFNKNADQYILKDRKDVLVVKEEGKAVRIENVSRTTLGKNAPLLENIIYLAYNDKGLLSSIKYINKNVSNPINCNKIVTFEYNEDNKLIHYVVKKVSKSLEDLGICEEYTYNEDARTVNISKLGGNNIEVRIYNENGNIIEREIEYKIDDVKVHYTYEGYTEDMKNIDTINDIRSVEYIYIGMSTIAKEVDINNMIKNILKNQ